MINKLRSNGHNPKLFVDNREYRATLYYCARRCINITVVRSLNKLYYYYVVLEYKGDVVEVERLEDVEKVANKRWHADVKQWMPIDL